ncbi:MAG: hypothetical protein AAF441_01210 [Pseudomonadota bacterium]
MSARRRALFELAGWVLFTASAAFFTLSSVKSGDAPAIAGSVLFLVACFVFMRPLLSSLARSDG